MASRYSGSLEALGTAHVLVLYRLPLAEGLEALTLYHRVVHEDVFAVLPQNEPESLCVVKPLDLSHIHDSNYLLQGPVRPSTAVLQRRIPK